MKIYTRTGDQGTTGLFSGQRVSKADLRLHAYGTMDELNAWLGVVRDGVEPEGPVADCLEILLAAQSELFALGSHLANDSLEFADKLPLVEASAVEMLEHAIDEMEKSLDPMRHFILPGGHAWVSQVHVARTVCRRAERWAVQLAEELSNDPQAVQVPSLALVFLNRLSDYLFVLSRWGSKQYGASETIWLPKKSG